MLIPWAEWLPDLPPYMNTGATTIKNCIPQTGGYAPFGALRGQTNALGAYTRGAIAVKDADQNPANFSGTGAKLYRLTGNTWADVTNAGGDYSLGTEDRWEFTQFGLTIIGVAFAENPQAFTIGSSSNFADLSGSPPKSKTVATVREFVVVGHNSGATNRVRWCSQNDSTAWVNGTDQAGQQDLADGGAVQRIIGGDIGYVFQDKAIQRMTYEGPPVVFVFDQIHSGRGIAAPLGVVKVGELVFFVAEDGFHVLDAVAGAVKGIGHGKVDQFFLRDLNSGYSHRVSAAADIEKRIVLWSYPSNASPDGTPDRLIVFHWPSGRWAFLEVRAELIFSHLTSGLVLESLDDLTTNIDDGTLGSLDSRAYKGGATQVAGFTTAHILGFFDGDNLEAVLETGKFEGDKIRRSFVGEVRPLIDAASITGTVRSSETLHGTLVPSAMGTMNSEGYIPVESSGRYHQVRNTIAEAQDWNFAQGVELYPIPLGKR